MQQLPADHLQSLRPTFPLKPGFYHTLGSRTLVMGILNVTDDSFSDGAACSLCAPLTGSLCSQYVLLYSLPVSVYVAVCVPCWGAAASVLKRVLL